MSARLMTRAETAPERHTGAYLIPSETGRARHIPTPNRIARRRLVITLTKWLLPLTALGLLASIALWPELDVATGKTRFSIGHLSGKLDGGRLLDARYNGVDEKRRPYTITAATARQADAERVALTTPKGDITLENGTWLMLSAQAGTYVQHLNQLDLVHDVTLYRDDGTTMHTAAASIDLKAGAAAGSDPVHVEGPFGVLDARGFTILDKGTAIEFTGPAHVVLNGTNH
ncbi:LPS export ABC transporter periplasmic protein LptC [Rhodopila sp.]|uniref:LPS export ABC transporter periplasmic protein LptC n=1 Tax=Rhodopila sp. TaxID=2480087 RepID=UPI003D0A4D1E